MPDVPITRVRWQEIEKVGMPPKELRTNDSGAPRSFLIRGEWSLSVAYVYSDGSGFDTDVADTIKAWAVIEGF